MQGLLNTLRALGPTRLIVMGSIAAALLTGFGLLSYRLTQPELSVLYGDLALEESGEIVNQLEARNVPYELRGNGSLIYVPKDQVARLRMALAEQGLPNGGRVGWELFDSTDGLSSTSFLQNINHLRALEGELSRTISSLAMVRKARVHLVLPKRELFARETQPPSASIVLDLNGASLTRGQVRAIQNLVASAVPRLDTGSVSIIDGAGTLLTRADGAEDGQNGVVTELRIAHEQRLKKAIERLVEQMVGPGRVRAQVTAEMNFDRITENTEQYDPDSQVARSTQTVEESSANSEGADQKTVSVLNNLPEGEENEAPAAEPSGPKIASSSNRTEETVNYEISRTVRTKVRETGQVNRLSVAVMIDGSYQSGENGAPAYVPRSAEEMQKITALVRSAIGFDEDRGDSLEVSNLQFARPQIVEDEPVEQGFMGLGKDDYFRIGEIAAFVIVGLLTLLLVIRPLLGRALGPEPMAAAAGATPALAGPEGAVAALSGPEEAIQAEAIGGQDGEQAAAEDLFDLEMVEGQLKGGALRKIGELVEKHPEEAVSIMRGWLHENA